MCFYALIIIKNKYHQSGLGNVTAPDVNYRNKDTGFPIGLLSEFDGRKKTKKTKEERREVNR